MIVAKRLKLEKLRNIEHIHLVRLEFPSVTASTVSDVIRMDVGLREGEMKGFRIACDSTDFNFSVFSVSSAPVDSVEEVLRVINMDLVYHEMGLQIFFSNDDTPEEKPYVYGILTENAGIDTGVVTVEFVMSIQDNPEDPNYYNK
jgi:hypothetical protein